MLSKLKSTLLLFLVTSNISFAQDWNLVWSDEFESNGAVNSEKWHHQTLLPNGYSWYNSELQHYTNRIQNSYIENGLLKIVAIKENFTDQGHTKQYTSARLNSKFSFTYGKVEVRAKLPYGVGTWPAIWTLGKNIIEPGGYWTNSFGTTSWPACGEIDIMEHWGDNQNYVQSATHTPSSYGGTINHGGQTISTASSEMHTYTLVWTAEKLVFSVDDVVHYTYNPPVKDSNTWPFDSEQYLLLNLAIEPNITPNFTQSAMEIDYVRVYQGGEDNYVVPDNISGCMDQNATDYNPNANVQAFDPWNNILCTYNSCENVPTVGCMYSNAFAGWHENFNASDCANYGGTPCETITIDLIGCMDENASNYDSNATTQLFDQNNNSSCLYNSCTQIPQPGCIYSDGFGLFNDGFGADDCLGYGGTPCSNTQTNSTVHDNIVFSGAFGGAIDENYTYYIPSGSESWAGFANEDGSIYPISFENGGKITFTASTDGSNVELYFKFEYNSYPDTEPSFFTNNLTINSQGQYSIEIPEQGTNTFSSFIMYITNFNETIEVTNVTLTSYGSVTPPIDITGCMDPNASNFNTSATIQEFDQYGNLVCIYSACELIPEPGCIYTASFGAFNNDFDATACSSYGGTPCALINEPIEGCTDSSALNYNSNATTNDGSCQYQCQLNWEVAVTDLNHSIFIEGDWIDVNGIPLAPGAAIGVFYQKSNGALACAGYTYYTGDLVQISVMKDDTTTDEIDGLTTGEQFTYRVWDALTCEEYEVSVNYTNGPQNFAANGITFVNNVTAVPSGLTEQVIEFPLGWSLFSTFIVPDDSDISSVLAPIISNIILAKDNTGLAYLPEWEFNGIGNIQIGQGYQVKTNAEINLSLQGNQILPEENTVELLLGWNILGYLRTQAAPANLVLAQLVAQNNLIIAKNGNGDAYLPQWEFNGIGTMKPGEAYQIKTNTAATFLYNSNNISY
jgi:beta-glucanase (GH16 family)